MDRKKLFQCLTPKVPLPPKSLVPVGQATHRAGYRGQASPRDPDCFSKSQIDHHFAADLLGELCDRYEDRSAAILGRGQKAPAPSRRPSYWHTSRPRSRSALRIVRKRNHISLIMKNNDELRRGQVKLYRVETEVPVIGIGPPQRVNSDLSFRRGSVVQRQGPGNRKRERNFA